MSSPQRAHGPGASPGGPARGDFTENVSLAELTRRSREQAEAEAAVGDVMRQEVAKAAQRSALDVRKRGGPPLRVLLLLSLLAFNLYLWLGDPQWLHYNLPVQPSADYYAESWRTLVYLQRERIEQYRAAKGHLPATAQQAGQPVRGVEYTPVQRTDYQLAVGSGGNQVVFHSTDSLSVWMGRTLLQMGLVAGGVR